MYPGLCVGRAGMSGLQTLAMRQRLFKLLNSKITSSVVKSVQRSLVLLTIVVLAACSKEPEVELEPAVFSVATDEGMFISADYKGKVIYLDFWASWCGPCRESFPWMNKMRAKYQDKGLEIIAVTLDQDKDLARLFAEEFNAEFTIGFDSDGSVADQFGVRGLPSSVIITRDGKLLESHTGFNQTQAVEFEAALVKALET